MRPTDRPPRYLRDIKAYVESVPVGEVEIKLSRVQSRTRAIKVKIADSLLYKSNQPAIDDFVRLIERLEAAKADFELNFSIKGKKGIINLVVYYSEKQTSYEGTRGFG